jgi:hypothetical protein
MHHVHPGGEVDDCAHACQRPFPAGIRTNSIERNGYRARYQIGDTPAAGAPHAISIRDQLPA